MKKESRPSAGIALGALHVRDESEMAIAAASGDIGG